MVHDGPAALETVVTFKPEVAFLDIGLPVIDGYELAERLRAVPELGTAPLVAITGYGQAADRQRARSAGFTEHLVKPLDYHGARARAPRARVPGAVVTAGLVNGISARAAP